jgi:hypothetical protein
MRPDDVLEYLRKQPFQPFRISLSNGKSYDIRLPEMVKVFDSQAHIYFHVDDDRYQKTLRYEGVALFHINNIEFAPRPAPTASNGGPST